MGIDKSNIEAYLLDYLEGNLDPLLTAELLAFLTENPEYEKFLPGYDGRICIKDGPAFENKALLKKDFGDIPAIGPENFDEFCIASAEGILQVEDRMRLEEYLSFHREKLSDFRLYQQLKLQPDLSVAYPGKEAIKRPVKRPVPVRFVYYALAAAATIALLLMLTIRKQPLKEYMVEKPAVPRAIPNETISRNPAAIAEVIRKQPPVPIPEALPSEEEAAPADRLAPPVAMEPIREFLLPSPQNIPEITGQLTRNRTIADPARGGRGRDSDEPSGENLLTSVLKKLNIWKAAETAVTGFNYLTEAQISLSRTTDPKGKVTGLSFETEQYTISGNKIK